jgi:hypothetical protein
MSTELKVYKEVTYIELHDGEIIALDEPYEAVKQAYNDKSNALDLGNSMLAKSAIKQIYPYKIDEVDNEILHIEDKSLRERVKAEVKKRRLEGARLNLDVLHNIIDRLNG